MREGFRAQFGDEQHWHMLDRLIEKSRCLEGVEGRYRVFGEYHVIGMIMELLPALRQRGNHIGANNETGLLELLQATLHDLCITVHEQDANVPQAVGSGALRLETDKV